MDIIFLLLQKILPLYGLILLGYITGKLIKVNARLVSSILIYIVVPIIAFNTGYSIPIENRVLVIPIIAFTLSSLFTLLTYYSVRHFRKDGYAGVLGFMAGQANVGYFGLPLAYALLQPETVHLYVLGIVGMNVSQNTIAAYFLARGKFSARESLTATLKLPLVYALCAGMLLQQATFLKRATIYTITISSAEKALTILGMMLIGLALTNVSLKKDAFFIVVVSHVIKFVVWPAMAVILIMTDRLFFHTYNSDVYKALWLTSIVPIAANSVAFALKYDVHADKVSVAVVTSTLFALFFIPAVIGFF